MTHAPFVGVIAVCGFLTFAANRTATVCNMSCPHPIFPMIFAAGHAPCLAALLLPALGFGFFFPYMVFLGWRVAGAAGSTSRLCGRYATRSYRQRPVCRRACRLRPMSLPSHVLFMFCILVFCAKSCKNPSLRGTSMLCPHQHAGNGCSCHGVQNAGHADARELGSHASRILEIASVTANLVETAADEASCCLRSLAGSASALTGPYVSYVHLCMLARGCARVLVRVRVCMYCTPLLRA